METISVDGEKYVKASSIAKELGYTADYVGQLARAKKINAALIGRTWYVKEASIRSHKTNRYRSSITKSKQGIKRVLSEDDSSESDSKNAYSFSYLKNSYHPTVKYETDEEDLIPILTEVGSRSLPGKSKVLDVELGDAEKVKVKSTEKAYTIETLERPKLTFNGHIRIADAEIPLEAEKPKRSGTLKIEKLDLKKIHPELIEQEVVKVKPKIKKPKGKGHHIGVIEEGPKEELVKIHRVKPSNRSRSLVFKIVVSTLTLFLIVGVFMISLMFETTTLAGSKGMETTYNFNTNIPISYYNMAKDIVISDEREIIE